VLKHAVTLVAVVSLASSLQASKPSSLQAKPAVDLTGVWVMLVEGHQIGLELEQDGTKVQGVMTPMGRRVLLTGTFVEGTLTLKGERPEDGAGLSHGDSSGSTPLPITATLKDDGTLEGELSTNKGRTKWTGERLKQP
jgi:hypothetical protein